MHAQRHSALPADSRGKLRLFLDTADTASVHNWLSTGVFYGVTCNPTIIKRDGVPCTVRDLTSFARMVLDHGAEEVHMQAWGNNAAQLSSVALDLAGIDNRVVVKLPCTLEGVQAASMLRASGIRVNITGIYSAPQVLVAQAVGAEYAAPYLGRMNDAYGGDQGMVQVCDMLRAIDGCSSGLRLMVASVRDVHDMSRLAGHGCTTFTISPTVASKLFHVQLTIDAIGDFQEAANSNGALEHPCYHPASTAADGLVQGSLGASGPGQPVVAVREGA